MMDRENKTRIQMVHLLGFNIDPNFKIPIMLLILILYVLTLTGNVMITALVHFSQNLKHPMFFFLSHLSLCDIILSTNIVPNMLHVIRWGGITISFTACIVQFQFFVTAVTTECLLLTVMSYDRYLAICNPLRYTSIMDNQLQLWLVITSWFSSFTVSFVTVTMINKLDFCSQNIINHFFCDFWPILQLSCSDTSAVEIEQTVLGAPLAVFPLGYIFVTYVHIFITIFRMSSSSGRKKALSTCSSHLSVVGIYFGTLIAIYVVPPSGSHSNANKLISLFYVVVPPLFNPIVYSLRNIEIKMALKKHTSIIKDRL